MVLDWKAVYSLSCELEQKISGSRVDKIYQTSVFDVYLRLRGFGKAFTLFLSCNPEMARAHLSGIGIPERLETPPMFCMLLRKHLTNARLTSIEQPNLDRILKLNFEGNDALGDKFNCSLILELMGRHSNLILVRDDKILGAARQTGDLTAKRPIITGAAYHLPEQKIKNIEAPEAVPEISAIIEKEFEEKAARRRHESMSASVSSIVTANLKKLVRKTEKLQQELKAAEDREQLKLYGELLTANIYRKDAEQKDEIEVLNYYVGENVVIPLDSTISLVKNAERYYKKYNKAKRAEKEISSQIEVAKKETEWLLSVQNALAFAETREDVGEIAGELAKEGYRVKAQGSKKTQKPMRILPMDNAAGFDIYVGKNNAQNDFLTLKFARGNDLWFHVQKMPSSHVLVRADGREVPDEAILSAAKLAATHSRAQGKVAVDYCVAKNVKKPRGGKPGFVIYKDFSTIIVEV